MANCKPHSAETKMKLSEKLTLPPSGDSVLDATRLKNRIKMRLWRDKNRERCKESSKMAHLKNPLVRRNCNLRHRFGITQTDYLQMFSNQNGCCGLCAVSGKTLVVDHCHNTGRVRGLLCIRCNSKLGFYEEVLRDSLWQERAKSWVR